MALGITPKAEPVSFLYPSGVPVSPSVIVISFKSFLSFISIELYNSCFSGVSKYSSGSNKVMSLSEKDFFIPSIELLYIS